MNERGGINTASGNNRTVTPNSQNNIISSQNRGLQTAKSSPSAPQQNFVSSQSSGIQTAKSSPSAPQQNFVSSQPQSKSVENSVGAQFNSSSFQRGSVGNTIQTAKSTTMVISGMTSFDNDAKRLMSAYQNKPVLISEMQSFGKTVLSKAENQLSSGDDMGSQTLKGAFASIEMMGVGVKVGVEAGKFIPKTVHTGFETARNFTVLPSVTVKGTMQGVKGMVGGGINGIRGGIQTLASTLGGSDDYAVQGVASTVQMVDAGARLGEATIKTAWKGTQNVAKSGANGIKTLVKLEKKISYWNSYVRANGIRKAFAQKGWKVGKKGVRGFAKTIKNVVQAIANFVGNLVSNPIGTLVIAGVAFVCVMVIVTATPLTSTGAIISGVFDTSDTNEEWTVDEFLADPNFGVPYLTAQTRASIYQQCHDALIANGGSYHLVRLKSDTTSYGADALVQITQEDIANAFYTDAEMIDIIAPVFNACIYMNYGGSPSKQNAKDMLVDLYNRLFTFTSTPSVEYCGQSIADGSGVAISACPNCGNIHTLTDCPNPLTGNHTTMTCAKGSSYTDYICLGHDDGAGNITYCNSVSAMTTPCSNSSSQTHSVGCDYNKYKCGGYSSLDCNDTTAGHTHGSSCYDTNYCSGGGEMNTACSHSPSTIFHCDGYSYCASHAVLTFELKCDGIYALINEVFIQPIDYLANLPTRTPEEEEQLQNLRDWYEMFNVIMAESPRGSFGGSITVAELNSVEWVTPSRTGNEDVINLAISQVGSVGGATYWGYAGFPNRVAWCACFVHWCMRNTPSATGAWADTPNNFYCQTVADYYRGTGQFHNASDYANITAGDCIFFDWECDGHTDHIGLVIGRDTEYVYAVEGNSGDAVKIKKYNLHSSVLYGYVFMNY